MKNFIGFTLAFLTASFVFAGEDITVNNSNKESQAPSDVDWRVGKWRKNIPEHLILLNAYSTPVITEYYSNTTPFGIGFTAGYQYRTRPWKLQPSVSAGFGLNTGLVYYPGKSIRQEAQNATNTDFSMTIGEYKSHSFIPVLLSANLYFNVKRTNIFLGLEAGINVMIGEKDIETTPGMVSIQMNTDELKVTRVVPTARAALGFMQEISPNFRFRMQAGVLYEHPYHDKYKGLMVNGGYRDYYHEADNELSLDPFVEIGIAYSL